MNLLKINCWMLSRLRRNRIETPAAKRAPILFLITLLLFLYSCSDFHNKQIETLPGKIPTEKEIKNTLVEDRNYKIILEYVSKNNYPSIQELQSEFFKSISDEELDFYYKQNKRVGNNVGLGEIDALDIERKNLKKRISYFKLFYEVGVSIKYSDSISSIQNDIDFEFNLTNSIKSESKDFKITVIEFSDYDCTYCAKFQSVGEEIRKTYGNKILWVRKEFPTDVLDLEEINPYIISRCVYSISKVKYWEFSNLIFKYGFKDSKNLIRLTSEIGIPETELDQCMNKTPGKNEIIKWIQSDVLEGKRASVSGTPTFFINKKKYVGYRNLENFSKLVESHLNR